MDFDEDGITHYIRGIVSVTPSKFNFTTEKVECDDYIVLADVAKYLSWIADNQ